MGNRFAAWLSQEMSKREWSQSDLARASGVHRATISKLLTYPDQKPSIVTCSKIAGALNFPAHYVLTKAGLIPEQEERSPTLEEANQLLDELPEEYRKQALAIIRFLHKTHSRSEVEEADQTAT